MTSVSRSCRGGPVGARVVDEPARDPAPTVVGVGVDGLKAAPPAGRDDAAPGDDRRSGGEGVVDRDVPAAAAGGEQIPALGLPGAQEALVVDRFQAVAGGVVGEPDGDHPLPQLGVGAGLRAQAADLDLGVRTGVGGELRRRGDEPDVAFDGVAAQLELCVGVALRAVGAIPVEGTVTDLRRLGERGRERRLPALSVAGLGRVVEDEQVALPVAGMARRADDEVVSLAGHRPVIREDVDERLDDERARAGAMHRPRRLPAGAVESSAYSRPLKPRLAWSARWNMIDGNSPKPIVAAANTTATKAISG